MCLSATCTNPSAMCTSPNNLPLWLHFGYNTKLRTKLASCINLKKKKKHEFTNNIKALPVRNEKMNSMNTPLTRNNELTMEKAKLLLQFSI